MAERRIIFIITACFLVVIFTGSTLSQRRPRPSLDIRPDMSEEEKAEATKRWIAENQPGKKESQRTRARLEYEIMQVLKRQLMISDRQWRLVEPQYKKVWDLYIMSKQKARAWGGTTKDSFKFHKRSKTDGKLNEPQRLVNELIDVWKDRNSTDAQIRQKIDTLQQAREKAKKQLPQERQKLRKLLTRPRQEALFLILNVLD